MNYVVVREYGRLTTDKIEATIDQATISASAFEYLCNLSSNFSKGGASLLQIESRRWLKLDNYVGVIETPCGTVLEILPKITKETHDEESNQSRGLLIKMLTLALELPVRDSEKANITTFKHSLLEWVMREFILALEQLVKRGIRFDYIRIEDEQQFLRGQLDISRQMRQPPGKGHIFQIRHDLFLADRPENRLLISALKRVSNLTQHANTWRISHELLTLLSDIPESKNIKQDFQHWKTDRLMAHYRPIRTWCELILSQYMPMAIRGQTIGISLLFPMEKLFERYVEVKLRKQLPLYIKLKSQAANMYLCAHDNHHIFRLEPDLLLQQFGENVAILDTKWKLISANDRVNKYGLSQSDFYQLFSYGHKYLNAIGNLFLIYPMTSTFNQPLPSFNFSTSMILWVIPFDLENDMFLWPENFSYELLKEVN